MEGERDRLGGRLETWEDVEPRMRAGIADTGGPL